MGSTDQVDHLSNFFINKLEFVRMLDIIPTKLSPTWRNMRMGDVKVAKRINHFLIY
jgi:hypothetical protein